MHAYDNWVLNTDICPDCKERYWLGQACGCPEEEEEDSDG